MFTETSAKVGINVKQLFKDLAETLPGVDQNRNSMNDPQAEARMNGAGGADGDGTGPNKPAFKIGGTSGAAQHQRAENQTNAAGGSGKKCC